jgi:hypothetical protein
MAEVSRSPAADQELLQHLEPRYLHQSAMKMKDGSIVRLDEFSEIEQQDLSTISEIRTHFIDRVKVEVHTATNSLIRIDDF